MAACAANTTKGEPCRKPAIVGGTVCSTHGGSAPQVRRAAARRLAEAQAARAIADVVVEPIANPLDALAELAAEAAAWKSHLANVVAELKDQFRFTDEKGAEHLDARVALFERAMDRCQRYLTDWVRLGFEERRVALEEARVRLVGVFVFGVLAELGHDQADPGVEAAVRRWSPVLDGEPAPMIGTGDAA